MEPTTLISLKEILTLAIPVIVCLIAGYLTYKNSSEIEKLKAAIKAKTDRDDYIFRLLMGYEDQNRTLYAQVSREYLIAVQQLKDEVKSHLHGHYKTFPEDNPGIMSLMHDKIIKAYSNLFPTLTDKEEIRNIAHEIKRLYREEVFNQLLEPGIDKPAVEKTVQHISTLQMQLATLINEEFIAGMRKLQQTNSANDRQ